MSKVAFVITPKSINIMLEGKMHVIDSTHPFFGDLRDELKGDQDLERLAQLVSIPDAIEGRTFGRVTVTDDKIYYKGIEVHNEMTKRIMALIAEGFDVEMWALFMDNVMSNPIESAREELYLWLEESGMPITPDGFFLAYKRVDDDYSSFHKGPKGKIFNRIGDTVAMPEEDVDTNRHDTCSSGLHFCAQSYLSSYGSFNEGRILVLKINPADVRAIPSDYNNAKGRTFRYIVMGEVTETEAGTKFVDTPVAIDHGKAPKKPKKAKKAKKAKSKGVFKYGGIMTAKQVSAAVKKAGSVRGAATASGVSKSTFQGWVKKIKAGS